MRSHRLTRLSSIVIVVLSLMVVFAPIAGAASPSGSVPPGSVGPAPSLVPPSPAAAVVPATSEISPEPTAVPMAAGVRPLVFAYYYIWYATTSWRRAKIDLPQLGTYDSRDRAVVAQQM